MKLFTAVIFTVVALGNADVSHLKNKYLPPQHHAAASNNFEQYELVPTGVGSGFESFPSKFVSLAAPEGAFSFTASQYSIPEAGFGVFTADSGAAPETAASFDSFQTAEYESPAAKPLAADSSYSAYEGASSVIAPHITGFSSDSSYTAPQQGASHNFPSFSNSFNAPNYPGPEGAASDVDTQYANDGGYVY